MDGGVLIGSHTQWLGLWCFIECLPEQDRCNMLTLSYMCGLLNCSQVRGVNAEVNTQRCEYTNRGVNTERGSSTQDVEENQQTQLLENFFA